MSAVFIRCLSGPISLEEEAHRERDVDRLHALAAAQTRAFHKTMKWAKLAALGKSFMALKQSNRADELENAVEILSDILELQAAPPPEHKRKLFARQAIFECVLDFCPRCRGAKEVPDADGIDGAQRMKPCPPEEVGGCGGTGRRRYSDHERRAALKMEKESAAFIDRHMDYAISLINTGKREATRMGMKLLEKW